jgi:hypothetical protein
MPEIIQANSRLATWFNLTRGDAKLDLKVIISGDGTDKAWTWRKKIINLWIAGNYAEYEISVQCWPCYVIKQNRWSRKKAYLTN